MGGQMSCSSPHPPSDSDRAAAASQSSYHKHKQKDIHNNGSNHNTNNSHLITQRLMKLASKSQVHEKQHQHQHQHPHPPPQHTQQPHEPDRGGSSSNGSSTGSGSRALPLSHPALSHSSAQQAFQSHTQPTAARPQSAQPPSDNAQPSTQQTTHPLRSSSSYQTLGPMVYVCCASSRIGIATIRGLRLNYPSIKIRAGIGMYENKSDVIRMFREAHLDDIDYIQVDPRKRQSLIWALVGVQALLVIPDVEPNVRTALAHVQAAKTAGVALVTVVTKPKPTDKPSIDTKKTDTQQQQQPHVVERYTLKTKLGCCFMRLPLDLVDDIVCPAPPSGTNSSLSPENNLLAGAPKFHLSDVGTACATILANHQQHVFTRYDLEVADADNKRKYQESIEQQIREGAGGTPTQIGDINSQPSTPDSTIHRLNPSRRGSTASTITDGSDRSNSSTPEHSRNHCRHIKQRSSFHQHQHQHQHHRSTSNSSDEHSPHRQD